MLPVAKEHHPVRMDAQDILHAVLDHQDGHALDRRACAPYPENPARWQGQGWPAAHPAAGCWGRMASTPASATFCFSPPESRKVSRSRRSAIFRKFKGLIRPFDDLLRGTPRFSRPNATSLRTFVPRICRSGSCSTVPIFCEICESFQWRGLVPEDEQAAGQIPFIRAWDQPIHGPHQRGLTAAAGTGDQQDFPRVDRKRNVADCRRLAVAISERDVFQNKRQVGHNVVLHPMQRLCFVSAWHEVSEFS